MMRTMQSREEIRMKATKILAGTLLALTLAGCGGMTTRERDTVVGAGVGAAAGAAITGDTGGAIGGAAIGGVIGNQVGRH
jgi:osmotically inducible lipoprotein OsmB